MYADFQRRFALAVTADNFYFWGAQTVSDIQRELAKSTNERPIKIIGADGETYSTVKSHPLTHPHAWDATAEDLFDVDIYLCNYGHCMNFTPDISSVLIRGRLKQHGRLGPVRRWTSPRIMQLRRCSREKELIQRPIFGHWGVLSVFDFCTHDLRSPSLDIEMAL